MNESKIENGQPTLQQHNVRRSFEEWSADLAKLMKQYPLVHNKWKVSRFRTMYNDGLSVKEAFRCWFCAH